MTEASVVHPYPSFGREVLAAAARVKTTFGGAPTDPVDVSVSGGISDASLYDILERYERHGFAVAQLPSSEPHPELLRDAADDLGVGPPFVPPMYANGQRMAAPITTISARSPGSDDHPSFDRPIDLDLHCDGTLQPIGYVSTSLLLCRSPAAEGGQTILFNAAAAFAELAAQDDPAAVALATPGVLVRQANFNGSTETLVGPVAATFEDRLACCYSVSSTDRWGLPEGVDPRALDRGLTHMERAASAPSNHLHEVRLDVGQMLILDNTVLSHGRRAYRDSPSSRRCVYRSLHLRHPGALSR